MPKCKGFLLHHTSKNGACAKRLFCHDYCGAYGRLPYWTPAERAGIKAMGRWVRGWTHLSKKILLRTSGPAASEVIKAYVKAARAAKEKP